MFKKYFNNFASSKNTNKFCIYVHTKHKFRFDFFIMLYGGAAMASLIACLYLLLRKSNAFTDGVTSPLRLQRWAAAFFAISFLGHIWWLLFYIYSEAA